MVAKALFSKPCEGTWNKVLKRVKCELSQGLLVAQRVLALMN